MMKDILEFWGIEMEKNDNGEASIIFGIINLVLVFLFSCLNVYLISDGLILLILVGIVGSIDYIKEGKIFAILGIIINVLAGVIYILRFFEVLSAWISKIF